MRWTLLFLWFLAVSTGCEDSRKSDLADAITGPAVEVNCAKRALQRVPAGVGDTKVDVTC